MKYVSLFAGIGGFDLALERNGHEGVYANDFDKYCKLTYDKHFTPKLDTRSILEVSSEEIPDHDILVGGFPCQSFSIAGLRSGFADTRGTLFFEIARILQSKRPPYLLLENVKGLLSHDNGRTFETILRTLDELGYELQWQVLNSKNFGVPQNRERVFIIGNLRGTRRPEVFPIRSNDGVTHSKGSSQTANTLTATYHKGPAASRPLIYVGAVMSENNKKWLDNGKTLSRNFPQGQRVYASEGISATLASQAGGLGAKTGLYAIKNPLKDKTEYGWHFEQNVYSTDGIVRTLKASEGSGNKPKVVVPVLTPDRLNKRQNGRRFKTDGEPSFTLTAQDKHGVFDGHTIRRLTPKECERLQGFPDGWTEGVSDTQRYKQLGNAVTVNVVEYIVKAMELTT